MYESIKAWTNVPAVRKPYTGVTGTGVKMFGTDVPFTCYPAGKVSVVTDSMGRETISNTQLYVDGAIAFNELDDIVFNGKQRPIKSISEFFSEGRVDIRVLYL